MARINTILLNILDKSFLHRIAFDTPQLAQFIRRTPKFKTLDETRVPIFERRLDHGKLELGMSGCKDLGFL